MLYNCPSKYGKEDFACEPDVGLLETLKNDVEEYSKFVPSPPDQNSYLHVQDLDEFLPQASMQWCIASLQAKGFTLPILRHATNEDGSRVHESAYLYLRGEIRQHMSEFGGDTLKLCTPPRKALDWQPTEEMQQKIPERSFVDEDQDWHRSHRAGGELSFCT